MKRKTSILFAVSVFVLVLALSLVSAAVNFVDPEDSSEITTLTITGDHNSIANAQFIIENDYSDSLDNIDLSDLPNLVSGSNTIDSTDLSVSPSTIASISADSPSNIITLTVSVPENQAPGTYSGVWNIVWNIDSDRSTAPHPLIISLTITEENGITIEETTPLTKTSEGVITITNTGNVPLTNLALEAVDSADFTVDFEAFASTLVAGDSIEVAITSTDAQNLDLGEDNSLNIKATSTQVNSSNLLVIVPVSFYEGENQGKIKISDFDISVTEGFGDDEDYWYPFDEVEIEFDVENKGDWDIQDIEIKVCLLDTESGDCVLDEDDMDISEDKFDLDEDDDEVTVTLTFTLNAEDLNADTNNYELYVSAVGEIDDSDSDYDEDETGESRSESIEIRTDEEFIIINEFKFQETVQCGAEVQLTADVWNIGDKKIDEDKIFIRVYNADLELDELIDFDEDISSLDKETLNLMFNIPEDAIEGSYTIRFTVYEDDSYSSSDIYENDEEDEAIYYATLRVEGACTQEDKVSITAALVSGGEAGKNLVVKATITNTGSELTTYTLEAGNYADWAESVELDSSTLVLSEGESKDVLLNFDVKSKVKGEKSFNINVSSDSGLSVQQPVAVSITESSGFFGITGNVIGGGENWYLWAIGALNVILVVIIIIVALRIARS
jgi:uncharacterized membrane protein